VVTIVYPERRWLALALAAILGRVRNHSRRKIGCYRKEFIRRLEIVKNQLENQLLAAGFSETRIPEKVALFEQTNRALQVLVGSADDEIFSLHIPGRIEFLGKHTDYAGGRSLICAVEQGISLCSSPRADNLVNVIDAGNQEQITFPLSEDVMPNSNHWSNYPMTVARRIVRNFSGKLRGTDIAFISDLPPAAGLSSSSALIVAFFTALADIHQLAQHENYQVNILSREDLADYLGCVENGSSFGSLSGDKGVGTFGGSQDHTAILCSKAGQLSQYSFCPVQHEQSLPLPDGLCFVIGVSGVIAEKTGEARDKYNRLSLATSAILQLWRQASGREDATLAQAIAHSHDAPEQIQQILSQSATPDFSATELLNRFNQFLLECFDIIPAVSKALAHGQLEEIGVLIDRSQQAAEELLGNQVSETIWLAHSARQLGAIAASAFGAGFGGSVWALVELERAKQFAYEWANDYRKKFPKIADRATFFLTSAGPPMIRL
jgi:galactokinase